MDANIAIKIKSYFNKINTVSAVYVFGSQAGKNTHSHSDIDIAVLFTKHAHKNFDQRIQFSDELKMILKKEIDICDIREAELLFAYRILSEGVLIYSSNQNDRIEFEIDLMRRYFDLKTFYEEYYDTIKRLAKEGKINARPFTY